MVKIQEMVQEMKEKPVFQKTCPFCPQVYYSYIYKTWIGLLRHVQSEHLRVLSRDRGYHCTWTSKGEQWKNGDLIYIRVYDVRYSKYHDIDIKSPEECEKLLYLYVTDNPSFRGFMKEVLKR